MSLSSFDSIGPGHSSFVIVLLLLSSVCDSLGKSSSLLSRRSLIVGSGWFHIIPLFYNKSLIVMASAFQLASAVFPASAFLVLVYEALFSSFLVNLTWALKWVSSTLAATPSRRDSCWCGNDVSWVDSLQWNSVNGIRSSDRGGCRMVMI